MKGAEVQHRTGGSCDTIATSIHGQSPRVTLKALLEAGVHFGHQAKRWNPKMKPYIFAERNGIHIIDLQQTVPLLTAAHEYVADVTARGGKILFVGTKKQAQDVVEREAKRSRSVLCQSTLARRHADQLRHHPQPTALHEAAAGRAGDAASSTCLPKQEAARQDGRTGAAGADAGRHARHDPASRGAIFIIDPKREQLAVHEARRLGIPVIAMADTNCDPDDADFLIPANDDAIRSVRLITAGIADAAIEGRRGTKSLRPIAKWPTSRSRG